MGAILQRLSRLKDVVLTTPSDGQVLTYDSGTGKWVNESGGGGAPSGAAGGVLGGTYPNPSFAADMATQAELDAHTGDTSDAHDASAISAVDAGGYFTGTDLEAITQELGADVGSLPDFTTRVTDAAASVPLTIPLPAGGVSVTHPDVVHVPGGWNGWEYWMACTPYPDADENPCIVVSDDGVSWQVPAGGSNPLATKAQAQSLGYDGWSDTDMVLSPNGLTMILFYRGYKSTGEEGIYRVTSTDGITWTSRVRVFNDVASNFQIVSPAFAYDDAGTTLYCLMANNATSGLDLYTSSDDGATWGAATPCTFPTLSGTVYPYHVDLQRKAGYWHALVATNGSTNANQTANTIYWRLLYWTSTDCITWTGQSTAAIPLSGLSYDLHSPTGKHYRSCFIPVAGNPLRWRVWVCGIDNSNASVTLATWRLMLYEMSSVRDKLLTDVVTDQVALQARTEERLFLPANRFISTSGSPSLGANGGSRFPAWLMDAAATEQVNTSFVIPRGWTNFTIDLWWCNAGAGAGDCVYSFVRSVRVAGDALASGDNTTQVTATAGSQNVLVVTPIVASGSAISSSDTGIFHCRISRIGGNASDTLANDSAILGIMITRNS